ncbi:MAG: recombinase family protein [Brevinema sp.]
MSGGTLNQPAIQELLQDIKDGLVNMSAEGALGYSHKIDRLTRSLHDFSKLVEIFDTHNASFVSVTQQFNTSTSMGRLTLNMMLSFAQFEREISGERVRDKKLASAKKGMWVYGKSPLGYICSNGILTPDPIHSETVKSIFSAYLELKSVLRLYQHLKSQNILTKASKLWSMGRLYKLLSNQVYIGKLPYKDQAFDGQHTPIISKEVFVEVQSLLQANNKSHKIKSLAKEASPLASLLFDEYNNKFYPSHSTKRNGIRYRYYINKALRKTEADFTGKIRQISAEEIERTIFLIFKQELEKTLLSLGLSPEHKAIAINKLNSVSQSSLRPLYLKAIEKITVFIDKLEISYYSDGLHAILQEFTFGTEAESSSKETCLSTYPISLSRGQRGACIVLGEIVPLATNSDILKAVRKSFLYHKMLLDGTYSTVKELAQSLGFSDTKQTHKILKLRYLAPDILTRILKNHIPILWTLSLLWKALEHDDWAIQQNILA